MSLPDTVGTDVSLLSPQQVTNEIKFWESLIQVAAPVHHTPRTFLRKRPDTEIPKTEVADEKPAVAAPEKKPTKPTQTATAKKIAQSVGYVIFQANGIKRVV